MHGRVLEVDVAVGDGVAAGKNRARRDVLVSIAAELGRNYFELRGTQRQLGVAHDNIDNERQALRLTQIRYEAGRVTELDVDSALARLKTTEATLPLLLPGIKLNTSPDNFSPIRQMKLASFNGESWELFGELMSD